MRSWGKVAASIAVVGQLAGCSLLFVKKAPPNVPEGAWADCSESAIFPAIDALYGVSAVIGSVAIAQEDELSDDERQIGGPLYALAGVGLLYSAYVGFRETSRCGEIHDAAEARGVYGPQPYYYPPPQPYPPAPQPYPPQPYPPQPYPPQPQPAPGAPQ
jgi:hypothetical protein